MNPIKLDDKVIIISNAPGPFAGQAGTVVNIRDAMGRIVDGKNLFAYEYEIKLNQNPGSDTPENIFCLRRDITLARD